MVSSRADSVVDAVGYTRLLGFLSMISLALVGAVEAPATGQPGIFTSERGEIADVLWRESEEGLGQRFQDGNGNLLAEDHVALRDGRAIAYRLYRENTDEEHDVRLGDGAIYFRSRWKTMVREARRTLPKGALEIGGTPVCVVRRNWNALLAGERKTFSYAVAEAHRVLRLQLVHHRTTPSGDHVFRLRAANWFMRVLVPSVRFYFAADKTFLGLEGPSILFEGSGRSFSRARGLLIAEPLKDAPQRIKDLQK